MKKSAFSLLCVGLLAATPESRAIPVFLDNFNGENDGIGANYYTFFTQWTVTAGQVDLLGIGSFDFFPGNGLYARLDGGAPGSTLTSQAITLAAGDYLLTFDLGAMEAVNFGGGPMAAANTLFLSVNTGIASASYMLGVNDPFTSQTLAFSVSAPTTINLSFQNTGGGAPGAFIDNIVLERTPTSVPEPGSTAVLFGLAFLSLGAFRRVRVAR